MEQNYLIRASKKSKRENKSSVLSIKKRNEIKRLTRVNLSENSSFDSRWEYVCLLRLRFRLIGYHRDINMECMSELRERYRNRKRTLHRGHLCPCSIMYAQSYSKCAGVTAINVQRQCACLLNKERRRLDAVFSFYSYIASIHTLHANI